MSKKSNLLLLGSGGKDFSGINDPTDIVNLFGWWDSSQGVTAGGSDITEWTSQDTNSWVATSLINDPDIVVNGLNSLNTINFNTELLEAPLGYAQGFGTNSCTIFCVFKQTGADTSGGIFILERYGSIQAWMRYASGTVGFCHNPSSPTTLVESPTSIPSDTWVVACVYRDGTEIGISLNGESFTTSTNGSNTTADSNMKFIFSGQSGGGNIIHCEIAEYIHYQSKLTSQQITDVLTYINGKWGV